MSAAPTTCLYCDGHGNSQAGGECGFCDGGTPLDTQADWDRTWGHIFDRTPILTDAALEIVYPAPTGHRILDEIHRGRVAIDAIEKFKEKNP